MIRHIWEANIRFLCPLMGCCLSLREQKQVLRKTSVNLQELNECAIHSVLICECSQETFTAKRIERLLNQKYKREIDKWEQCDPGELAAYAKEHLNHETFCSTLWITAVWIDLSAEKLDEIYCYLHMFTHQQFHMQKTILNQAAMMENKLKIVQDKYLALRKETVMLKEERQRFVQLTDDRQKQIDSLREQLEKVRSSVAHRCIAKVEKLQEKLVKGSSAFSKIQSERDRLKEDLRLQSHAFDHLREEFQTLLARIRVKNCDNVDCTNYDLCARRVLVVGGISKLRSFYEKIVNDLGGQFDYHDGSYHKGEKSLMQKIHRSDIVLCPVDVNSHAACLSVKRHSKKLNKSYFMLPNSSISTIYDKLSELAI